MSERLCIVMPVYNEQDAIGRVLVKWHNALTLLGVDFEIRPYNDGSKDDSLEVMHKVAQTLGNRVKVQDKPNGGHGNTILKGYREAAADGFDWIFQVDSDDEMGPEMFGELWARRTDCDFIVGKRDGRKQPFVRKAISFVSRLCVKIFYGNGVWDVNTPYRLMRVSAFRGFYKRIPQTTFAPNVILSGIAARHRLRALEIAVPQHDRTTGEVSIRKWKLLKAAAKSFWQTCSLSRHFGRPWLMFWMLAAISTVVKFCMSIRGWNYDFESYQIVAKIVNGGGNVYAETVRYNYGPVWFLILGGLKSILGSYFRYGIIALLSAADIGIAALLWQKKHVAATTIFFLSIVSMHITGYHNQFDNLAILAGFASFCLLDNTRKNSTSHWFAVFLLGISIIIKHVFLFIPLWFFFRNMPLRKKILSFAIPLIMFTASFVPFSFSTDVHANKQFAKAISTIAEQNDVKKFYRDTIKPMRFPAVRIVENVFAYRSSRTSDFKRCFLPQVVIDIVPDMLLFAILMSCLGYLARKKDWFSTGLIYTLGIFVFSPSMAMQYYAIPCAAAALYWRPFGIVFHILAGGVCLVHPWSLVSPSIRISSMCILIGCLVHSLKKEII